MLKASTIRRAVSVARLLSGEKAQLSRSAGTQVAKSVRTSQTPPTRYIPATTEQIQCLSHNLDGIWHDLESAPVLEGNFYDGEFVEGRWHGQGKLHLRDGTTYAGEFFAGRRNGSGTLTRADGSQLIGVWDNGRLSETVSDIPASNQTSNTSNKGRTSKHSNNTTPRLISEKPTRTKNIAPTSPEAESTYTPHTTATILQTTTKSDEELVITYSNGDLYSGAAVDQKKHGYGVLHYGDGGRYEGQWRDNLQHGLGTAVYPFGATYTGQWAQGLRHGQGSVSYVDGSAGFTGEFRQNKVFNGTGRYVSVSGAVFTGTWVEGLLEGQGSIFSDAHSHAEGEFRQGKVYNGTRVYRDQHGKVFKVTYSEGKQVKSKQIKK